MDLHGLSIDEQRELLEALRVPRGRYVATRAAQLAGVPERTLYDWAKSAVLVPDFSTERPKRWSYRDLVFARMTAWLRTKRMERSEVVQRVHETRAALEAGESFMTIRSAGDGLMVGDEHVDRQTGQAAFELVLRWIDAFELVVPTEIKELGRRKLWGPHLVHPSRRATISPWVMGGEPCVVDTRVPTSSLFALHEERDLGVSSIVTLYPGLDAEDVEEALALERKLRRVEEPMAA